MPGRHRAPRASPAAQASRGGRAGGSPGTPRCDIVTVRAVAIAHRDGCGAVTGAAAAWREGPAGRRGAAEPPRGRPCTAGGSLREARRGSVSPVRYVPSGRCSPESCRGATRQSGHRPGRPRPSPPPPAEPRQAPAAPPPSTSWRGCSVADAISAVHSGHPVLLAPRAQGRFQRARPVAASVRSSRRPVRRARLPPGRGLHREVTGLQDRAASLARGGEQGVVLGGTQRREPAGRQVSGGPDTEVRAVRAGAVRAERVPLFEHVRYVRRMPVPVGDGYGPGTTSQPAFAYSSCRGSHW